MKKKQEFRVVLSYGDYDTDVTIKMSANRLADVLTCAKGWLMSACGAKDVLIFDVDGNCVGAYVS